MRLIKIKFIKVIGLAVLSLFLTVQIAVSQGEKTVNEPSETELQVGIIQRLGENSDTKLIISGTDNNLITLNFPVDKQENITINVPQVELNITQKKVEKPLILERVVLSDHGTFETAEDSALNWGKLGLEVQINQPDRWQVWAQKDVYNSPLLRRLLIESLQKNGYTESYLDTKIVTETPEISFQINDKNYTVETLEILSQNNVLKLKENDNAPLLYGGKFKIQPNSYGNFTLVNQVPIETYLRGVVPHEIGPQAPTEAVKAQTIIARTYALRNVRRFQADNYELCANTHCQVYKGLNGTVPRVDQAIKETAGKVLTYNNQLVDALYYSTSGGITSSFTDIWNGENRPYLKSVIDAPKLLWDLEKKPLTNEENVREFLTLNQGFNETGRRLFRWNKKENIPELNDHFRRYLERTKHPLANFNTITKMTIKKRSISGRILEMDVETDLGLVTLYKTEVRSAFGPPVSTLFYLEPIFDQEQNLTRYSFIGGGFGHGVGLSQFGSYNLANLGWTSDRILQFYYPNTVIQVKNNE